MKKIAVLLAFLGLIFIAPHAKAEVIYGFLDGKFYDESQTLKYVCFLDSNCYDLNGKFAFSKSPVQLVAGVSTPTPSPAPSPATPISAPVPAPVTTDSVAPTLSVNYTNSASGLVSWVNPTFQGWGSYQLSCSNCIRALTDEDSTVTVTYMNLGTLPEAKSAEWEANNTTEYRVQMLNTASQNPANLITQTDSVFSKEHIIHTREVLQSGTFYVFIVRATDKAGNVSTGSYTTWNMGQQTLIWNNYQD